MPRLLARPARRFANTLPFVCIALVVMVGMVAFAIDTAYVAATRTQLQRTADAGAMAGVQKLVPLKGHAVPEGAARAEVNKFVTLNEAITVRTEDVKMFRYDPSKPAGSRVSYTYSQNSPPNGVEVTLRRDAQANGPLNLFFAPALGQKTADVRAKAHCYLMPGKGLMPGSALIPFTMQVDYYMATLGQQKVGVDGKPIVTADDYTVRPDGTVVSGPDNVLEIVLFTNKQNAPGNFGSIDLGGRSNPTPVLNRQILNGATWADFHHPEFVHNLAADGNLYAPFGVTGDTGISAATKDSFSQVFGLPRIIPLYDTVTGTGNGAVYNIVGFATVTMLEANLNGNPKRVWIQPSKIITDKVTVGDLDGGNMYGVYTAPRLVVP